MKHPPCIALLTDFGTADPYVGIMKGAILSINSEARIVDVSHESPEFRIEAAGMHLRGCAPYFPTGTLFVVVVDPGVGSKRRILYGESARHRFLAPDNGVLSFLKAKDRVRTVRAVTNRAFMRSRMSTTFHGRDVFAPVAGWLSLDTDPAELGPRLRTWAKAKQVDPKPAKDGSITGRVLGQDRFGNLLTDIPGSAIRNAAKRVVAFQNCRIAGISKTYADRDPGEVMAVIGSAGYLEIALNQGSAARRFRTSTGSVTVLPPGAPATEPAEDDTVFLIETNLDNVSGESVGILTSHLFSCGALDVWTTPIQMKKSRPAVMVSVLTTDEDRDRLARELLLHSPTFGVRIRPGWRIKLGRRMETVRTKYGKIPVKIGSLDGRAIRAAPEFEDVAAAARRANVPFEVVHLAASEAGRRFLT